MTEISKWSLLVVSLLMFVVGCGNSTSLEGKVEEGKGQPLANVRVVAKMSQPITGYEQFETTTHTDGSFKFEKLFPKSEYQLIFYSESESEIKKLKIESGPKGEMKILPEKVMIRFIDFKGGVVLDTKTNLMWAARDSGSYTNWANAKFYCEHNRGGGYTDWRMPTQDELSGLFDSAVTGNKGYSLTSLIGLTEGGVWASETSGSEAAFFYFSNGYWSWFPQSGINFIRALPVRSGK